MSVACKMEPVACQPVSIQANMSIQSHGARVLIRLLPLVRARRMLLRLFGEQRVVVLASFIG